MCSPPPSMLLLTSREPKCSWEQGQVCVIKNKKSQQITYFRDSVQDALNSCWDCNYCSGTWRRESFSRKEKHSSGSMLIRFLADCAQLQLKSLQTHRLTNTNGTEYYLPLAQSSRLVSTQVIHCSLLQEQVNEQNHMSSTTQFLQEWREDKFV